MKKRSSAILLVATLCLATLTGCQRHDSEEELLAKLIDSIYTPTYKEDSAARCALARWAWDELTDAQKARVKGEHADPDYFGLDTGDASLDDPLNADEIGENEILIVSFGTSFNESRVEDIGGVEKAVAAAWPDWSVRRAFTSQIIVNHILARDDEKLDNVQQALDRAVANGVKNLVVLPTLLMRGAEYDEAVGLVERNADKFETVRIAEPLLGRSDASDADKESAVKAVVAEAVRGAGYESLGTAASGGVAFVLVGHGTSHAASVAYSQTQAKLGELGYDNVWIGTVEGKPESTELQAVIDAVAAAGYKKVVLRPFMVVAGDHAHNDIAGDDEDSWKSRFVASGKFESVDVQIAGLGRIAAIRDLYLSRLAETMEKAQ
ncbi:MAG: sirohydrochlorin cobaltochelatase [Thermoguttaceae bacterium]|nr:sirohydrochlorin cobaltochelatase [Thermoguttaceae bacterium]